MPVDITEKFTTHLKDVLARGLSLAVQEQEPQVLPEHLLWATSTQKGSIAAEVLKVYNLKFLRARKNFNDVSYNGSALPLLSNSAKRVIERAVYIAHSHGHRYVGTEHLLASMLEIDDQNIKRFFKENKVETKTIREQLEIIFSNTAQFAEIERLIKHSSGIKQTEVGVSDPLSLLMGDEEIEMEEGDATQTLDFFTTDLTNKKNACNIDPVIGRDAEIQRVMEILCRRTKNNPVLTGEPGVGKTAIVEGLARRIAYGEVPPILANKRVLALDMAAIVAGTNYRGEFESRLKRVIDEARANQDIVLFIDELHSIIGAGAAGGTMDAASILKPALARGEIRCIGATTMAEFKKHIEADSALERRFQHVKVGEPNTEDSIRILRGLAPYYEAYHRVSIKPEALDAAVRLSQKYISDRFLPDKAIDLIDEASASVKIAACSKDVNESARQHLEAELRQLREQKSDAIAKEDYEKAMNLKSHEFETKNKLKNLAQADPNKIVGYVGVAEIASVINRATGIPINELISESVGQQNNLSTALKNRIVGQDHALDEIVNAITRAKSGINNPNRPQASFLFVGPSGVGKTELARALAEEMFHDKNALIHLDMSEYGEGYTVSKLVGSPPGYVGYRESAKLTDQVKQKPYAVVLFDELEKAHRDVQALLLQILETGSISDATGKNISFKQTVVIMTTNAGAEKFRGASLGFAGEQSSDIARGDVQKELEENFRPELLNRIDGILLFKHLGKVSLAKIAEMHLNGMAERAKTNGITITYAKELPNFVAQEAFSEQIGARAIRRYIQDIIENAVAQKILEHNSQKTLRIKRAGKNIVVS
jgi:ATP-dependent Clp protease ATP-binding subunit ClpC